MAAVARWTAATETRRSGFHAKLKSWAEVCRPIYSSIIVLTTRVSSAPPQCLFCPPDSLGRPSRDRHACQNIGSYAYLGLGFSQRCLVVSLTSRPTLFSHSVAGQVSRQACYSSLCCSFLHRPFLVQDPLQEFSSISPDSVPSRSKCRAFHSYSDYVDRVRNLVQSVHSRPPEREQSNHRAADTHKFPSPSSVRAYPATIPYGIAYQGS